MWSCCFNKCSQLHEGFLNTKIFFDRENGWTHTATLQWHTKRRKPANVCNLNFISLKQHSFFSVSLPLFLLLQILWWHHLRICPCSWALVLVLKYFMQSLGKAHSCLWASHTQEIRLLLFLQFPVFWCVSENWKAALIVMVSLEMSSEFAQEWRSSWWPHQSELLWSEYERTELKDWVWGKGSVWKGHLVKKIKERTFSPLGI